MPGSAAGLSGYFCFCPGLILVLLKTDLMARKADCSHATRERARLLCGYGNCEQSMGDDTALIQIS